MKTKKQQVKQKIIATVIVVFMAVMIFGSRKEFVSAANVTNTTLIQNFVAGALNLETWGSLSFNDLTIGVAGNSLANLTIVNIRDYRGSGAGWTVTGVVNNMFTSATGAANYVNNAVIAWAPGAMYALDGGASNTGVTVGTGGYFSAQRTLASASANNGFGNYKMTNTIMNIVYNGNAAQKAGNYQGILQMTIQ